MPLVVAFFEGADGDVAVLPKPLILNPAGTEGQVLINAPVSTNEIVPGWSATLTLAMRHGAPASLNLGSASLLLSAAFYNRDTRCGLVARCVQTGDVLEVKKGTPAKKRYALPTIHNRSSEQT
jgi:hypothetical protein